jgi:hypothetical protein
MFFAYIDESGDPGTKPGSTRTFTLACVLVGADTWPDRFDRLIAFRRHLRDLYGLPVRAEIKANYLLRNAEAFRLLALTEKARFALYRQCMRLHTKLEFETFAVVVNKQKARRKYPGRPPDDLAWERVLQRLERFAHYRDEEILIIHDEGNALAVRTRARKARRAGSAGSMLGTGLLSRPFERLVDDPVSRNSKQSYFLQLADLAAYAAFRRHYPPPKRETQIVPRKMWDELGSAALIEVNKYSGGPAGLVHVT